MNRRVFTFLLLFTLLNSNISPNIARAQSHIAKQNAAINLAGVNAEVTIRRDERGIPHIEAHNENDLYFAQGYATASDRLWQMDLLRRTARGELSELFGNITLDEDKRHRTYGFAQLSENLVSKISTQTSAALEAYARGVNAYIESLDGKDGRTLPPEFLILQYKPRAWRPADSIVIGKIFAETLSTSWPTDLMRATLADLSPAQRAALLPETSTLDVLVVGSDKAQPKRNVVQKKAKRTQIVPSFDGSARNEMLSELSALFDQTRRELLTLGISAPAAQASNNWVVSGKRTATGKPLLANDPHLPASAPSIWHMVHLQTPGLNVAGVTAPGAPGVILGHNDFIAWGATNLGPDVQDLYLEKFNGENSLTYATPAGARQAEVRHEEIKVRKSLANPATEILPFDVKITRHGPIILERGGARYALRWTALDPSAVEFESFYKLNRAHDWDDFRAALREYRGPTQNFIYADTRGHIGYYGAGLIPVRKSGDGSTPYDGSTDDGEWIRFIPFDALPHVIDPQSGIIVTANQRVVGNDYPYQLTHEWAPPYRARRIYDLLNAKQKLTTDDFRLIQGDTYSIGGASFAHEASAILSKSALPEDKLRAWLPLIAAWDGRLSADSRAAPLVSEMRRAFLRRILNNALGDERARHFSWESGDLIIDHFITERPAAWLPKEFKDYDELLRACQTDALASLNKQLGADETQWTWGNYRQVKFPHPLAVVPFIGQQFLFKPFPQNGGGGSIGAAVNVGANVSMRFIADMSDLDHTQQGIALGESGLPVSPHWSDQLADWRAATPRVFPFSKQAVANATRETLIIKPINHASAR